jgi:RNA recognition motif-containing protein
MDSKLYVGNVAHATTEDELRTLFAQAGTIERLAIPTDRDTNQPRGFALVQMATAEEAQKAITMLDGQSVREQAIRVKISQPKNGQNAAPTATI